MSMSICLLFVLASIINGAYSNYLWQKRSDNLAGTVYFITNLPTGNRIIASNIDFDGKLTYASVTYAGGNGSRGVNSPFPYDPLFSSNSITVSSIDNLLAVVNAGSDTVALFEINQQTPAKLTMIGRPVNSGGEFPVSLAFNKSGKQVCVLNGGAVNGIKCFSVDKTKGLIPIESSLRILNANETTPPSGPFGAFSQLIFNEAGNQLVAAKKGLLSEANPGFIALWDVAADGTLSDHTIVKNTTGSGFRPFSFTIIPGRNAFFSADAAVGIDIFKFQGNNFTESSLTIPNQVANCWTAYSTQTGNYYVNDLNLGIITEVHLDSNLSPSLVTQYRLPNGSSSAVLDSGIANVRGQDYLYALSPPLQSIIVMRLTAPGNAEAWQTYNFTAPAIAGGATIDGPHLQGMAIYLK